jgi:hypothetical protein
MIFLKFRHFIRITYIPDFSKTPENFLKHFPINFTNSSKTLLKIFFAIFLKFLKNSQKTSKIHKNSQKHLPALRKIPKIYDIPEIPTFYSKTPTNF